MENACVLEAVAEFTYGCGCGRYPPYLRYKETWFSFLQPVCVTFMSLQASENKIQPSLCARVTNARVMFAHTGHRKLQGTSTRGYSYRRILGLTLENKSHTLFKTLCPILCVTDLF